MTWRSGQLEVTINPHTGHATFILPTVYDSDMEVLSPTEAATLARWLLHETAPWRRSA